MNQNIINKTVQPTNNFIEEMERQDTAYQSNNDQVYSELTGGFMDKRDFKHNNMVPFLKNEPKIQKPFAIRMYLIYTPEEIVFLNLKETTNFFAPTPDLGLVNGTQLPEDRELERYISSNYKTNELPFEKIRVRCGLNNGYTSAPTGRWIS